VLKVNQLVRQLIPSESKGPPDKMAILANGLTFSVEKVVCPSCPFRKENENRTRFPS
jgi:hypothetical protein